MDIRCGSCGSENLTRDTEAAASTTSRCSVWTAAGGDDEPREYPARDVGPPTWSTLVDGWAFEDREDAREHPETAAWGYVDKTVFRCRRCRDEWVVPGQYRPYRGDGATPVTFRDDDEGYRAWLRAWPQGYMLNCEHSPNPRLPMLHTATCHWITERQPGMTTFTGDYIKVCATNRQAVRRWAREKTGDVTPCHHCM